jgi:hypothetical protein
MPKRLSIPYYRVNSKTGRAYWCPTAHMRRFGFEGRALGFDGENARKEALLWCDRWKNARAAMGMQAPRAPADDATDTADLAQQTFIYFLQVGDRIKIGVSKKPFTRLKSITAGAHGHIAKVIIVPGSVADERWLHRHFDRRRVNGEWFSATPPLVAMMLRCAKAGRLDPDDGKVGWLPRVESRTELSRNTDDEAA